MIRRDIPTIVGEIIAQVIHDHGLETIMTPGSQFGDDLGMDDEDVHAIIMRCEDVFHISIPDDITLRSRVADLAELVSDLLRERDAREARAVAMRSVWNDWPEDAA